MSTAALAHAGAPVASVMVVDDSAVARGLISRQIDAEPDMAVVASAANGAMALVELKRRPVDLIVLDIEMPVMDGMTALPQLLAARPGVKILIASTLSRRNAEISLKALQLGAADYLPKPDALVSAEGFNRELVGKIRALTAHKAPPPDPAPPPVWRPQTRARPSVIAIGGSTGAPPVLVRLFEQMKGRISQPILITQHMPATFTAILAEQLGRAGGKVAAEGIDGETIEPGRVYVAPGGWHMTARREGGRTVIRLNQEPPEHFCRPAVDPMLRSLAEAYGPGVMAVVLTGMGSDGAKGCEAVVRSGGRVVVQDEATSAVWGMPGAAVRAGVVERVLPLEDIAPFVTQAVETGL